MKFYVRCTYLILPFTHHVYTVNLDTNEHIYIFSFSCNHFYIFSFPFDQCNLNLIFIYSVSSVIIIYLKVNNVNFSLYALPNHPIPDGLSWQPQPFSVLSIFQNRSFLLKLIILVNILCMHNAPVFLIWLKRSIYIYIHGEVWLVNLTWNNFQLLEKEIHNRESPNHMLHVPSN